MTSSPHVELLGRRRGTTRWLSLGAFLAAACGGRELSLGGDPVTLSVGSSGNAGRWGTGGGTDGSGATPSTGGSGGVLAFGGTGGTNQLGGSGGSAADGAGGAGDDPYPPVSWQEGQGYRDVCPEYDDTSGFTCWHEDDGRGTTCALDGSPVCNACSCAIPCDEHSDCPPGASGEPAGCFGSSSNVSSCFLRCDASTCPAGMACSTYPGTSDRICMWVDAPVGMFPAK